MHPYEVAQTLRQRAKQESVRLNYGSLYGMVDTLEKRGLITPRETIREGRRPERTVYEITPEGARETTEWLADLLSVPVKEYPQFMAGLSFMAALPPDEARNALWERRLALEFRLVMLRGVLEAGPEAGLPRLFALESEYEERMVSAEFDYVRQLLDDIDSGSLDGLELWRRFHSGEVDPATVAKDVEHQLELSSLNGNRGLSGPPSPDAEAPNKVATSATRRSRRTP
jgi:DNA-binding PadR family transcriptional regulator